MKAFYSDLFSFPLPPEHKFPLQKYELLRQRVISEGILPSEDLLVSKAATDDHLLLVHSSSYLEQVKHGTLSVQEMRRIGFPWSWQLVERSRRSVGGTLNASRAALVDGIAANLAGGTHHAHPDFGAGFCMFNDVAIAIRVLQQAGFEGRTIILDCDVHQGDGSAAIFSGDSEVFTFSIHGEKNFPFHKARSDLDVGLPDGASDEMYLEALSEGLTQALNQADAQLAFFLAGADPFTDDLYGRLDMSKAGLERRDRLVLEACSEAGLAVAVVMAGGYAPRIADIVDIHYQTIQTAVEMAKDLTGIYEEEEASANDEEKSDFTPDEQG